MALVVSAAAVLAACVSVGPQAPTGVAATPRVGPPYQVNGIWYVPRQQPNYNEVGTASWYGDAFHGRSTADGEIFDMNAVSGAHTTLPLPCLVEVTNLENGRKLIVRVNDRGPFVGDRIIDLSHEAARQLGYDRRGLTRVRVRYVGPAPLLGPEAGVRVAQAARRTAPRSTATARAPDAGSRALSPPGEEAVFTSTTAPAAARRLQVLPATPPAAARIYRVQVGAFADEGRARRAAAQLAGLGPAAVAPYQRAGTTLYKVVLPSSTDVIEAYGLRERVAEAGFAEAVVTGPS